eukprot:scaffold20709_cov73-Skeletonema_dohrnii-CCMP3373.AAC.1
MGLDLTGGLCAASSSLSAWPARGRDGYGGYLFIASVRSHLEMHRSGFDWGWPGQLEGEMGIVKCIVFVQFTSFTHAH